MNVRREVTEFLGDKNRARSLKHSNVTTIFFYVATFHIGDTESDLIKK